MNATKFNLADRASYQFFDKCSIRFSDQDEMGHVNNVAYAAYVEAGRLAYFMKLMEPFGDRKLNYVLANVHIDYVLEMHYPGMIDIGVRMTRIGQSSFATGYGVFLGDVCHATATCVNVHFDQTTRKSAPFDEDVRAMLMAHMASEGA